MLQVKNVSFSYTDSITLNNIDFSLEKGMNLAVIGESGCGKSTLLKLIYGLYDLDKGSIFWNNVEVLGPKFNLIPGMDFMKYLAQDFDLMPFITVAENIGKYLSNSYPEQKNARIAEAARIKAAKLEAERLEAKRLSDERAAKAATEKAEQESWARERDRRSRESEKYAKARRDALKKAGVFETDVLNLIVDAKSYEGKQVFLQCAINLVSSGGGNCWSADDKQRVSIDDEGIDKETFKWMLQNCRNQYSTDNARYCQFAPVVGTVVGSSFPRLKNVYFYELCKKRVRYPSSLEDCDTSAHE
jgi:energy-coupling factor transporter ATP-binding protein EcfA2